MIYNEKNGVIYVISFCRLGFVVVKYYFVCILYFCLNFNLYFLLLISNTLRLHSVAKTTELFICCSPQ